MNGSTVAPPSVRVTPPPSVMVTPEPVRTFESVKKAAAAACISSNDTEKPKAETVRPDRHTCPKCNNDWPIRFGTKCFSCNGQRSTALGAVRAPPGKYDGLWEADATSVAPADSELTPVKSTPSVARHTCSMRPELRRDLEADALKRGFVPVGDRWMKLQTRTPLSASGTKGSTQKGGGLN